MLGVKPSFATGFAQWPGVSGYSNKWQNLVGAWRMLQGISGHKVLDLSGYNNVGTVNGAAWTISELGNVLRFIDNDYITMTTDRPSLKIIGSQITILAYAKFNSIGAHEVILWKNNAYSLQLDSAGGGKLRGGVWDGVGDNRFDASSGGVNDGLWHLCAMIYDGVTAKLYQDTTVVGTDTDASGNIADSGIVVYIGSDNGSYGIDGWIGLVMVFNRALIYSEILWHYDRMKRLVA